MPSVVPIVPAPVTASSRTLDWEMALPFLSGSTSSPLRWWGYAVLARSFKDGSGQSVPLPGVELSNQAQCKLLPEVFDNSMAIADGDRAVMLDQREGIDYAAFKEKPQDVLITLLGLGSKPVVPPELVTSVNPSPPPPMNLLYATTFGGMSWTQPARLSACASPLWDQWAGSGSTLQIPASCLARCWSQDFPSGGRLTRLAPGIPL